MHRRTTAFRFPLDDHSVDSGLADLHPLGSSSSAWTVGAHSTFHKASRASEQVQTIREQERRRERLITLGISLVAVAVGALLFLLRG